jgi:hypothetical protein
MPPDSHDKFDGRGSESPGTKRSAGAFDAGDTRQYESPRNQQIPTQGNIKNACNIHDIKHIRHARTKDISRPGLAETSS